jgi:hypothetical protein
MKRLVLILAIALMMLGCVSRLMIAEFHPELQCPQCKTAGMYSSVVLDYIDEVHGCLSGINTTIAHYHCSYGHTWQETKF